jgi:hypothetical protein
MLVGEKEAGRLKFLINNFFPQFKSAGTQSIFGIA